MRILYLIDLIEKGNNEICGCKYKSKSSPSANNKVKWIDDDGNKFCGHCVHLIRETVNVK